MAVLTIVKNGAVLMRVPLDRRVLSIGSSPANDVQLPDAAVAPFQLAVARARHGHRMLDESGQGLPTEGRSDIEALRDGDELKLGPFVLRYDAGVPADVTETLPEASAAGKAPNATLEWNGRSIPVTRTGMAIGSAPENALILTDPYASSLHCRLFEREGRWVVRDLGSTNGTFVDGVRTVEAQLPDSCTLTVGRAEVGFKVAAERAKALDGFCGIIGRSEAMQRVFRLIERAGQSDATVLVYGETGVGKELVARGVHLNSRRAKAAYHAINCGAIPAQLVESELFGHEKGAFTGATARRRGAFEVASAGTLFLDEIGELPKDMQVSLLRTLDTGEIRRVGSEATERVDTRVVAATNRDLRKEVDEGEFREDLMYRLYVVVIEVPPLRERGADIQALATHFLRTLSPERPSELSPDAERKLLAHGWPGNVRELRNTLQRALVHASSPRIGEQDIVLLGGSQRVPHDLAAVKPLEQMEREAVIRALRLSGGNKKAAALSLGIDRTTMHRKLKQHSISDEEFAQ